MNLFAAMDISASALTAERLRMDIISNNLANVNTTRTENGGPYRRQIPVFTPREADARHPFRPVRPSARLHRSSVSSGMGVRVSAIIEDPSPPQLRYDPGHPDADENGMVAMPNVHPVHEMVDLISASRAYEANVTAINAFKSMAMKALEIGRA